MIAFRRHPRPMPKVNQELIAQRLNLSRATVSRSLANHPAISAETRRLVQEMAAKLGYKLSPGRVARRGKKSRTFTIGVVIGVPRGENVTMVTYPHILKGIRDRAEIERVTVDVSYQPPAEISTEAGQQALMRQIRNKRLARRDPRPPLPRTGRGPDRQPHLHRLRARELQRAGH
jgi:LacI family transcriptional regulator